MTNFLGSTTVGWSRAAIAAERRRGRALPSPARDPVRGPDEAGAAGSGSGGAGGYP